MQGTEFADADQHPRRAAQRQIGPPDLRPTAPRLDPAGYDYRIGEAGRACLFGQRLFQPRRGDKEDAKIAQLASSPSVEAKNIAWLSAELT